MKLTATCKKVLIAIAALAAVVLLLSVIGSLSDGFKNMKPAEWFDKEANPENLYQSLDFAGDDKGMILDGADGVTVELIDDNAIKVRGTSEIDQTVVIGTITLNEHTAYIFDASLDNGSNKSMYMTITAGEEVIESSYTGPVIIHADAFDGATEVTVSLVIAKDCDTNVTLRPVLCPGADIDDAVDFYL